TSTSSGQTLLQGTTMQAAGGGIELRAGSLEYAAAHDTRHHDSQAFDVGGAVQIDLASVGLGLSGDYTGKSTRADSRTAVVGKLTAQGKVSVRTDGDAMFTGTAVAGGDVSIVAGGNLEFRAAETSRSSTTSTLAANGGVSASMTAQGVNVGVNHG